MRDGDIIADGEPVSLVCLSVHYKNVGTFAPHNVKAHGPLPSISAREACPPAVNDFLIDPFCARFSWPDQHHPCSDSQLRVRDPTKAKMRRFFAKKGSGAYPIINPQCRPAHVILGSKLINPMSVCGKGGNARR